MPFHPSRSVSMLTGEDPDGDGATAVYTEATVLTVEMLTADGALDSFKRRMRQSCQRYADRNGYAVVSVGFEEIRNTDVFAFGGIRLILEARLRARWDGPWGDLRRALAEDGLLPPVDRANAPADVTDAVEPTPEHPIAPYKGQIWTHPHTDQFWIWSGTEWIAAVDDLDEDG